MNTHDCDVLVIGAGPGGLAAAVEASDGGRRVTLIDSQLAAGGQIWRGGSREQISYENRARGNGVEFHFGREVVGGDDSAVFCVGPDGLERFQFQSVVVATGARELFLPFPGWTLPGVFGAGGLQAMAKGGFAVHGMRVAVCGSGPLLVAVAAGLEAMRAEVVCLAEQAPTHRLARFGIASAFRYGKLGQSLAIMQSIGPTRWMSGWWPVQAVGNGSVDAIELTDGSGTRRLDCDLIACSFGLVPNLEVPKLLGAQQESGFVQVEETCAFAEQRYAIGELTGIGGVDKAVAEGRLVGRLLAGMESQSRLREECRRWREFATLLSDCFALRDELRSMPANETTLCRCEGVPLGIAREYDDWRQAKMMTRLGMGPCQGRVCGAACRFLLGLEPEVPRTPLFPTTVQNLIDMGPK